MTSIIDTLNAANTAPATAAGTSTGTNAAGLGALDENAFLQLLTTQMTTQDPFNPMDNTQMVAQLAQFSQVAGISQMNTTLTGIASSLGSNRISDAASWIGHAALTQTSTATALVDGSYAAQVTLPSAADQVTVNFVDSTGQVVHSQALGQRAAGATTVTWNGQDSAGNAVAGPLHLAVSATSNGQTVTPTIATWAMITGIQSPANGGSTQLVTPVGNIAPTAALQIS